MAISGLAKSPPAHSPEAGTPVSETPGVPMRRVSFYIPEPLYQDIQEFAHERGDSMTGVLRWSLGVGKAVWDEVKLGHKIRSTCKQTPGQEQGISEKELVFSRY